MGIVLNSGLVLKAMSIYGRISRNDYYRKSKKLSENAEGLFCMKFFLWFQRRYICTNTHMAR